MPYITQLKSDEKIIVDGPATITVHPRSRGVSHFYVQVEAGDDVQIQKQRIGAEVHHVDDS